MNTDVETTSVSVELHPDRPSLMPSQPVDFDAFEDDDDIYRGEQPSPARSESPDSVTSSSSSSSSERAGGRLGAIAAVVELAISRWARGIKRSSSDSASSSSSSSSSSRSSVTTVTRARRRSRRLSQTSLHTVQSERDIAARITRLKALEESRQIPREFALYIPPTVETFGNGGIPEREVEGNKKRIVCTTFLPSILNHLEVLTKKVQPRRPRGRSRGPQGFLERSSGSANFPSQYPGPDYLPVPNRRPPVIHKKSKKGKHRETAASVASSRNATPQQAPHLMPKAWFLDVASPTWEDLRAIGKLLHLHPLTLEDILQQDPREKLEVFPKLGYYFISFRAIESRAERERIKREARSNVDTPEGGIGNGEGPIGEANVYLTVSNEGICCFHYRDISEHIDRVRNRIVLLEEVVNMSSDWIAHDILDSIVDAFFPFLSEIEKEAMAIDHLIYSGHDSSSREDLVSEETIVAHDLNSVNEKISLEHQFRENHTPQNNEKEIYTLTYSMTSRDGVRPRFAAPRPTLRMILRRSRRYTSYIWESLWMKKPDSRRNPIFTTLQRMTKTRRLVTSLGRLLATKSDVVTQIRKRLVQAGEPSLGNGGTKGEEREVAIYMGDVQDHILTLQHSLTHIERMLSQSHPSYLSQLRNNVAHTKGGTDRALMFLTTVSMAVLCCQTLIGVFSMNLTIPTNEHASGHPHNVFGTVVALACLILATYFSIVRRWWKKARRRAVL